MQKEVTDVADFASLSRVQSPARSLCLPDSAVFGPDPPYGNGVRRDYNPRGLHVTAPTYDVEKSPEATSHETGSTTDASGPGASSCSSSATQVDTALNLVQWNGDDDPSKPQNWKQSRKWTAIAIGAI
jgi:hypothetical protein